MAISIQGLMSESQSMMNSLMADSEAAARKAMGMADEANVKLKQAEELTAKDLRDAQARSAAATEGAKSFLLSSVVQEVQNQVGSWPRGVNNAKTSNKP